ncbi:MAG TPA: ABC transporter ATP-binding protein [Mycobacteriales bacterium]|jgi:ABC-2 type transport system ATP-binding protein|nr:ABC transporter ATP-binding protein [Mycobacteriales bacterium]
MPQDAAAVVRGLRRSFGRVTALDGVDVEVRPGEVFGLLGPNGAGKSTFVRCLVGLLAPDAGTVTLLGHDLARERGVAPRAAAYLAQEEAALADLTVALAVELTGRLRGLPRRAARGERDALLDELGLAPLAARPLARLSGGQRRLAAVATALAAGRPLLVLDEPTTGLDTNARRAVWAALDRRRAGGTTVVLVTHNVLEAETVLDRVAVFDRGRVIACDTPGRLKAAVSDEVRLDLVWRADPPLDDETVAALAARADVSGRRWRTRLPAAEARAALARLTTGPAFAALDDFTLATPTLEDVYLALGGRDDDLERA